MFRQSMHRRGAIGNSRLCIGASDCIAAPFIAALAVFLSTSTHAQTQQQYDWCGNEHSEYSPAQEIDGCSALIFSGQWAGKALAPAFYNRAQAYARISDHYHAIADYSDAIELDADNIDAFIGRGIALHATGDNQRAIADYTNAVRINPKYAIAYYTRQRICRDG
jgi:tetratricopeptide (TPR) repeat protein